MIVEDLEKKIDDVKSQVYCTEDLVSSLSPSRLPHPFEFFLFLFPLILLLCSFTFSSSLLSFHLPPSSLLPSSLLPPPPSSLIPPPYSFPLIPPSFLLLLFLFSLLPSQGMCPLVVMATAGTTVLGAFDPINEIANVCEKHSVWLHIDVS